MSLMFVWVVNFYYYVLNDYTTYIYAFTAYLIYFDFWAHTLIAVNRCTAIKLPLKHEHVKIDWLSQIQSIKIWSGRRLKLIIFLLFLIPLAIVYIGHWMNTSAHYHLLANGTQKTLYYDVPSIHMVRIYKF
jgi:hypothetical protein